MSLQGKTVVVTGGLGALGQVVVETAAARGASVAVLDHATQVPEGLAERLGAKALFLGGIDLSSPAISASAHGAPNGGRLPPAPGVISRTATRRAFLWRELYLRFPQASGNAMPSRDCWR